MGTDKAVRNNLVKDNTVNEEISRNEPINVKLDNNSVHGYSKVLNEDPWTIFIRIIKKVQGSNLIWITLQKDDTVDNPAVKKIGIDEVTVAFVDDVPDSEVALINIVALGIMG